MGYWAKLSFFQKTTLCNARNKVVKTTKSFQDCVTWSVTQCNDYNRLLLLQKDKLIAKYKPSECMENFKKINNVQIQPNIFELSIHSIGYYILQLSCLFVIKVAYFHRYIVLQTK